MVLAHDTRGGEGTVKRTADIDTDSDVAFDSMLLAPRTLAGLTAAGFSRPSPVQLQGIPTGKCGFNLLLEAKSGTGKTAVFAVIALELLDGQAEAQTVILAPTREIAAQISDVIKVIGSAYEGLTVEVVMGGLPLKDDIQKFLNKRKVQVIVGSPGRLRQMIEKKYIDTASARLLVLDEADKLMQGSFQRDINYIFSALPNCKQVIMSSATYPEDLKELINKYMSKYLHICPDSTSVLLGIEQKLTVVNQHSNIVTQTQYRYVELVKILKSRQFKQCLIFCNYQARVVEVYKRLTADKWPAQFLHGQQEQTDRLDALKTLQEYKCRILVSTDLAARGIDASNVDLVINFEVPYEWETYLHRIGRAGRYGSYGLAITMLAKGVEEQKFKELLRIIGGPINMRDLWTDAVLDFNDVSGNVKLEKKNHSHDNLKELNISSVSKIPTEQLWKLIVDDKTETMTDTFQEMEMIEEFDKLTHSYENAEGTEYFTDLQNSFENSNIVETKAGFPTLNLSFDNIKYDTISNHCLSKSDKKHKELNDGYKNIKIDSCNDDEVISDAKDPIQIHKKRRHPVNSRSGSNKKNVNSRSNQKDDFEDVGNTYYGDDDEPFYDTNRNVSKHFVTRKSSTHHRNTNTHKRTTSKNFEETEQFGDDSESNVPCNGNHYQDDSHDPIHNITWKPVHKTSSNAKEGFDDHTGLNAHSNESKFKDHYSRLSNTNRTSQKHTNSTLKFQTKPKQNHFESVSSSSESSHSATSSFSDYDSCEKSDENVRWTLTSEEGKKLYRTLKKHKHVVQLAYKIVSAESYEVWKKKLAARKAQIQMAVYMQEMAKLGTK